MGERNQQFDSFAQWVNRAPFWLTARGPHVKAICEDAKGRPCRIGADFMRARDEDAFPVRWRWPDQSPSPFIAAAAASGRSEES
jgi:hypothetical protein